MKETTLTVMAPCSEDLIMPGWSGGDTSTNDFVTNVNNGPLMIGGEGENGDSTLVFLPNNILYETSYKRGRLVVETGAWWVEGEAIMLGNVRDEAEIVLVQGDTAIGGTGGTMRFCRIEDVEAGKCLVVNATINTREGDGVEIPAKQKNFNSAKSNTSAVAKTSPEQTWTDWLNRDTPGGSGDYETIKDFLAAGQIKPGPVGIECQTTAGIASGDAGQVYTCSVERGGICRNAEQENGKCLDYQVRFRYQ